MVVNRVEVVVDLVGVDVDNVKEGGIGTVFWKEDEPA